MVRQTARRKTPFQGSFTFNDQVGVVGDARASVRADDAAVAAGAALRRVPNADGGGETAVVHHSRHHQRRVFAVPLLQGSRTHTHTHTKRVLKFSLHRVTQTHVWA